MRKQIKILIADDNHSIRNLIKSMLVKTGLVNFDEAENGIRVLEKLKKDRFHLVICDWDMPGMDGLEVLRSVRADESLFKIPFILVTATAEASKVAAAIEEGVDGYIIKPFRLDDFTKRINNVLSNR